MSESWFTRLFRDRIKTRSTREWLDSPRKNPKFGRFSNDCRMSEKEKNLVNQWVEDGAPEGEPADLPQPLEYAEGWRIPTPDVVYRMPKPFSVPAKGVVPYKYFVVDPGFEEDRWVVASEGMPGNREVVHHLILFYQTPEKKRIDPLQR